MAQYSTRAQHPRNKDSAIPRSVRDAIFAESAHCCVYCGWVAESIDHIIPRSYGGTDERYNLVASCLLCNYIASDKIFDDVDKKREYILNELRRSKYARRKQLNFCIDCGELFRQSWQGSTRFLCGNCAPTSVAPKPKAEAVRHIRPRGWRFTPEQVIAIRRAHASGQSQYSLAKEYNVGPASIRGIVLRLSYKDVE